MFKEGSTNSEKLFRGEFIFPPEGLATNLDNTLRGLEEDDVIQIDRDSSGTPQFVELSEKERLCGRENYDFYCFLIWPFLEASWLGAVSLLGLTPPLDGSQDVWIDNKKAQDSAQLVRVSVLAYCIRPLTSHSSEKHCITREICPTSRLSIRKLSRTRTNALQKRALFLSPRTRNPEPGLP